MAKYIVTQDEPTWLRTRYEVEADSEDEAREMVAEGQYEYLGYEVDDRVEPVDNQDVSVVRVDDTPSPHVDMLSHGWDVFDVDGTGRMEIQRVDDPVDKQKRDVDRVFKTDAEAISHVVMLADRGNPACREALKKVVQSWNLDGAKNDSAPGHWDVDSEYPVEDWMLEVGEDSTRLGYHAWVENQREMKSLDDKEDST